MAKTKTLHRKVFQSIRLTEFEVKLAAKTADKLNMGMSAYLLMLIHEGNDKYSQRAKIWKRAV